MSNAAEAARQNPLFYPNLSECMANGLGDGGDSAVLSDDQTDLIQLVPCDSEVLLFFNVTRVTIPDKINEIGEDLDIVEYLGTDNLNFCPLIISKAPHDGLRSGNVRADTKLDAPYSAKNAYFGQLLLDEG